MTTDIDKERFSALEKEKKQLEREHKEMRIVLEQANDALKKLTHSTAALLEDKIKQDKELECRPTHEYCNALEREVRALKKEVKQRDRA